MKFGKNKLTFFERLLGQQAPSTDAIDMPNMQGIDTTSQYYLENMGEAPAVNITASQAPRVGGILPDISAGFNENKNTPVSLNNFGDNNLPDGRNKGFAYRLGEGLGSIARFGASPVGRGLLMAGIVGATGGGALPALAFGGMAGVGNQGYRMRDAMYRNQLKDNALASLRNSNDWDTLSTDEQNARIKAATDEIDNVRGYLDNDVYSNIVRAQQLRDNAEYRKMYYDNQIKQNEIMNQIRQDQLNFQKGKEAFDQMIAGKKLSLEERKMALEFFKATQGDGGRGLPSGGSENLSGTYQGINQMTDLKSEIDNLPSRITTPGIAQLSALNPFDTDAQAFNQYVKTYKQVIGKGLEGGVLRKEDEYKYDQIIPKMGDTKAVLRKKADQLQNMLVEKYNTDLEFYGLSGYNVNRFPQVNGQSNMKKQAGSTTQIVTKLKKAGYSDEKIQQYLQRKGLL